MHSKSNQETVIVRTPIFVDDATVCDLLSPAAMLSVIGRAFVDPPTAPIRSTVECSDGAQTRTLLTMPALRAGGIATVKIVTVRRGAEAGLATHLLALDAHGRLIAIIEGHKLTARRTAAASVLAAQTLGAGRAQRLAVLGAGPQARAQIEAYAAALPIAAVTLWARRDAAAQDLSAFCADKVASVRVAASPDDAVRDAEIVTCATASETPLVRGDAIAPGAHIDLVGGFRPNMREADDGVMRRATIVADTTAALVEAGDLVLPIAAGVIDAGDVQLMSDMLTGPRPPARGDITVFKSVGHAAEDLVATELLLDMLASSTMQRS